MTVSTLVRLSLALGLVVTGGATGPGELTHPNKLGPHCLMLFAQAPPLPTPGNPNHQEPAPGESCVHNAKDPAHDCTCHRECRDNTDDDGYSDGGVSVQEDPKCRVYCYKDHCHCPVANCE